MLGVGSGVFKKKNTGEIRHKRQNTSQRTKKRLRFCYTKADRILKRFEFQNLYTFGKKFHGRHFVAIYAPGRQNRTRLGVTVSKKVGHAAIRNRIKRLSREYFRLNKHWIAGNWDINITARKTAAKLSSDQMYLSLKIIFESVSRSLDH